MWQGQHTDRPRQGGEHKNEVQRVTDPWQPTGQKVIALAQRQRGGRTGFGGR